MKDKFFLLIGIVVIAGSFYLFLGQMKIENSKLKIGESVIDIEIADTDTKRTQGLSGRETLEPNHGMLFVFDTPGQYGFWMKDMRFPIDIVWIDENWIVVGVERGARPDSFPQIFNPPSAIKYVLEVPVNSNIDIGTRLYFDS